ncbi:hypothetical protein RND81_10G209900 [Saponaria officinalis]|uniref:BZIP domain-containing protein n=1 Tax=Saponaria officinalis TaxID=3572 RepID=A0AAW1I4K1_SAPOF
MYLKDEFKNKSNDDLSSFPREVINNSSQYCITSNNFNKFIPNIINSNYEPLNDNNLITLNPTNNNVPSPSNDNNNNNEELIIKENDEEQEIRRLKRMLSNRESARRSRLRKRRQLETLQHQVCQLVAANYQLGEQLVQVTEANYRILQENAQLRQDAVLLQKNVTDLITSINNGGLEEEEEGSECNLNNEIVVRASHTITSASITNASLDVLK